MRSLVSQIRHAVRELDGMFTIGLPNLVAVADAVKCLQLQSGSLVPISAHASLLESNNTIAASVGTLTAPSDADEAGLTELCVQGGASSEPGPATRVSSTSGSDPAAAAGVEFALTAASDACEPELKAPCAGADTSSEPGPATRVSSSSGSDLLAAAGVEFTLTAASDACEPELKALCAGADFSSKDENSDSIASRHHSSAEVEPMTAAAFASTIAPDASTGDAPYLTVSAPSAGPRALRVPDIVAGRLNTSATVLRLDGWVKSTVASTLTAASDSAETASSNNASVSATERRPVAKAKRVPAAASASTPAGAMFDPASLQSTKSGDPSASVTAAQPLPAVRFAHCIRITAVALLCLCRLMTPTENL